MRKNHEALLKVQKDVEQGVLQPADIQRHVRRIVHSSEEVFNESYLSERLDSYYLFLLGMEKRWQFLCTWHRTIVELLLSPVQPDASMHLPQSANVYAYAISFKDARSSRGFYAGMVDCIGRKADASVLPEVGYFSLQNVLITSSEHDDLCSRWNSIIDAQATVRAKLGRAAIGLQARFRRRYIVPDIDDVMRSIEAVSAKKKKKKRKKKKGKRSKVATVVEVMVKDEEAEEALRNEKSGSGGIVVQTEKMKEEIQETSQKATGGEGGGQREMDGHVVTGPYFRVRPWEVKLFMVRRGLNLLCDEMGELVQSVKSIVQKKDWSKQLVFQQLQASLKAVFPCSQLHLFGSYATGLALPGSDIDCFYNHVGGEANLMTCEALNAQERFRNQPHEGFRRHVSQAAVMRCSMYLPVFQQLETLRQALWTQPWVKQTMIVKSSMPILRLQVCAHERIAEDKHEGKHLCAQCFTVDLSCGHCPGHTNFASIHFVNHCAEQFPQFRNLTLVLKLLLQERMLDSPFKGGLGSFPLCVMVQAFFKLKTRIKGPLNRGSLLLGSQTLNIQEQDPQVLGAAYRHLRDSLEYGSLNLQQGLAGNSYTRNVGKPYTDESDSPLLDDHLVGSLFLEFLDFFGNHFDPRLDGISVATYSGFFRLRTDVYPPFPIWIDNPFWSGKNITSSAFQTPNILQLFRECHKTLMDRIEEYNLQGKSQHDSILRSIFTTKWGRRSRRMLMHAFKVNQFVVEPRKQPSQEASVLP